MVKIYFKGSPTVTKYAGDGITCYQGEELLVTEEKKTQLWRDHRDWFETPDEKKAREKAEEMRIPKPVKEEPKAVEPVKVEERPKKKKVEKKEVEEKPEDVEEKE